MVWRDEGPRLQLVRTSGSTNEALQFYTNSNREAQINAARMRGHRWVGMERGEREMYFWGSPIELSKQDRIKRIRDWLVNDGLTERLRAEARAGAAIRRLLEALAAQVHFRLSMHPGIDGRHGLLGGDRSRLACAIAA